MHATVHVMDTYPPTAQEFLDYMTKHRLLNRHVAELLQMDGRAVSNWRAGAVTIPYANWHTLRTKIEGTPPE